MLIDENDYKVVKNIVQEINHLIDFKFDELISLEVATTPQRSSYLAGEISALTNLLEFIAEKEQELKKDVEE